MDETPTLTKYDYVADRYASHLLNAVRSGPLIVYKSRGSIRRAVEIVEKIKNSGESFVTGSRLDFADARALCTAELPKAPFDTHCLLRHKSGERVVLCNAQTFTQHLAVICNEEATHRKGSGALFAFFLGKCAGRVDLDEMESPN